MTGSGSARASSCSDLRSVITVSPSASPSHVRSPRGLVVDCFRRCSEGRPWLLALRVRRFRSSATPRSSGFALWRRTPCTWTTGNFFFSAKPALRAASDKSCWDFILPSNFQSITLCRNGIGPPIFRPPFLARLQVVLLVDHVFRFNHAFRFDVFLCEVYLCGRLPWDLCFNGCR